MHAPARAAGFIADAVCLTRSRNSQLSDYSDSDGGKHASARQFVGGTSLLCAVSVVHPTTDRPASLNPSHSHRYVVCASAVTHSKTHRSVGINDHRIR